MCSGFIIQHRRYRRRSCMEHSKVDLIIVHTLMIPYFRYAVYLL